jgi:hypothetical protein
MQLGFRLLYILNRLIPISVYLLEVLTSNLSLSNLNIICIFLLFLKLLHNTLDGPLQKDGERFSSHEVLVRRVQAEFKRFAESTEQSCRER